MKFAVFALCFVLAAFYAFSCASQPPVENTAKLIGRIEIYGSEPRTFVGIVDEDGVSYAVYAPSHEQELRKLQGRLIEFTVVFLDESQGYRGLKGGIVATVKWEIIR
jgi:hypothetical protein